MAANQWFSGYVNWAYQRKIIGGMGDGTFQPDGTLTYAQAIKMYVVASGVDDSGYSYPNDYIAKATELGILNNVYYGNPNDGASRGNIAVMGYNKLTGGTTPGGAVPGYSFAPQVPDFGAMLGIAMSDSEDTGTMIMCAYILDGKYPTAEEQYKQALADFGFQFIISDEVDGVLMHGYALNGDITDYRVLYAYDSSVMVIGVIRPNSQQVPNQYYTEHPDILNFGTYTGVPLYYQENYEGFDFYFYDIYHPNYSKDKAYSYMNELENTGYLFDFSYKDSDGMTMNVFTKGIQSVVIGATFIENHPFVMVMVPPPNTRSVSVYRSAVGHVQIAADEFQNEQVQLGRKYGSLF